MGHQPDNTGSSVSFEVRLVIFLSSDGLGPTVDELKHHELVSQALPSKTHLRT